MSISRIVLQLSKLYALVAMEESLGWFVTSGLVSIETAKNLPQTIRDLIKDLAPQSLNIVNSFGLGVTPVAFVF